MQRSEQDIAHRESLKNVHTINSQPEFMILDSQCIIDQYAFNGPTHIADHKPHAGRTLKKSVINKNTVQLDRFQIQKTEQELTFFYLEKDQEPKEIGTLKIKTEDSQSWLQAQYQWRYAIEEDNQFFWVYEKVCLNVAFMHQLDKSIFINQSPSIVFKAQA